MTTSILFYFFTNNIVFRYVFNFLFIYFYIFWPRGMQDLSSPTRDQTRAPCSGGAVFFFFFFFDREEVDLFREKKHTPQTECGPSQKARKAPGYGVVSLYRGG